MLSLNKGFWFAPIAALFVIAYFTFRSNPEISTVRSEADIQPHKASALNHQQPLVPEQSKANSEKAPKNASYQQTSYSLSQPAGPVDGEEVAASYDTFRLPPITEEEESQAGPAETYVTNINESAKPGGVIRWLPPDDEPDARFATELSHSDDSGTLSISPRPIPSDKLPEPPKVVQQEIKLDERLLDLPNLMPSIPDPNEMLSAENDGLPQVAEPADQPAALDVLLDPILPGTDLVHDMRIESSELPALPSLPTGTPTIAEKLVSEMEAESDLLALDRAESVRSNQGERIELDEEPSFSPVNLRTVKVDSTPRAVSTEPRDRLVSAQDRQLAQQSVDLGFELIQRGAPYSARARFVEAMRIVSRSLDEQNGTNGHTKSLRKALAAHQEAGDFFPKASRPDEDTDIAFIIGGHDTSILHDANTEKMTATQCVREYAAFAEQEFVKAFGKEEIASKALYGLGRLESNNVTTSSPSVQVRTYRTIALYQSSIVIHQANFAAANELGVLLAQNGNYEPAVAALQHCLKYSPQPKAWQNLASVYRRLGNLDAARHAENQAAQAQRHSPDVPFVSASPRVEWVTPDEFVRTGAQQPAPNALRATNAGNPPSQFASEARNKSLNTPSRSNKKPGSRMAFRAWPFGKQKK